MRHVGALHPACSSEPDPGVIRMLIEAGADPELKDERGLKPVDTLEDDERERFAPLLRKSG